MSIRSVVCLGCEFIFRPPETVRDLLRWDVEINAYSNINSEEFFRSGSVWIAEHLLQITETGTSADHDDPETIAVWLLSLVDGPEDASEFVRLGETIARSADVPAVLGEEVRTLWSRQAGLTDADTASACKCPKCTGRDSSDFACIYREISDEARMLAISRGALEYLDAPPWLYQLNQIWNGIEARKHEKRERERKEREQHNQIMKSRGVYH